MTSEERREKAAAGLLHPDAPPEPGTAQPADDAGLDHAVLTARLIEVRVRIIRTVLFWLAASVAVYIVSPRIIDHVSRGLPGAGGLIFLSPAEAFVTRIKLALAGGLALAVPFILLQVVGFFSPTLSRRRRRAALAVIPLAVLLFAAGMAFGYAVLLPFAVDFLLRFSGPELVPMLSLAAFIRFVMWLVVPLGFIFQLPLVISFLAGLGILDARAMARRRKYAVLAIFIISALLTPTDVFSQFMMAVPLLVLYEISLIIARIVGRRAARRRDA